MTERDDATNAIAHLGSAWSEAVADLAGLSDDTVMEVLSDALSAGWDRKLLELLQEDIKDARANMDEPGQEDG